MKPDLRSVEPRVGGGVEATEDRLRARLEQTVSEDEHSHRRPQRQQRRQHQQCVADHQQKQTARQGSTRPEQSVGDKSTGETAEIASGGDESRRA
jgi:hypothetical protein